MTSRELLMFGPLPIRILAGIAFIVAGLPKFENISINQGFFDSLGLPPELVRSKTLVRLKTGIVNWNMINEIGSVDTILNLIPG
jgi:putative oxidoreductase